MNLKWWFSSGSLCTAALLLIAPAWAQGSAAVSAPAVSKPASKAASKAASKTARKFSPELIKDESVSPASLKARYPAGSVGSVKQADAALADVTRGRQRVEAVYSSDEKACYKTFFANRCVVDAKERRRIALEDIKPIQIEADRFKRHDVVVRRDKALEEKRLKDAATVRPDPGVDKRAENFDAKRQEAEKKELAATGKHAENQAAFAKKVQDREAAQRKVEEKRAKTEKRRKKKAASAAAAAANRPPASSSASTPVSASASAAK